MNKRVMQSLIRIILFVTVAVILLVTVMSILPAMPTFAVSTDFEETDVMDDLLDSTVNDKPFNLLDYSYDENGRSPQLFNFVEYCYSFRPTARKYYGLYLYIYNQQGLNIEESSVQNKVQMAVAYDSEGKPSRYEKFDLRFCSVSTKSGYEKLFYKYKVIDREIDGTTFAERVNSNGRRYDVSGFELLTKGTDSAKDYTVGGTYTFTGYTKGCGADPEANSSLACAVNNLETIELDVRSAFWRDPRFSVVSDSEFSRSQNEVTSVYFSVDKKIFDDYGKLQKIRAEWWEYTSKPILVTNNTEIRDKMLPHVGKNVGDYDSSVPIRLYEGSRLSNGIGGCLNWEANWSWNKEQIITPEFHETSHRRTPQIPIVLYSSNTDITKAIVSGEEFGKYVYGYNASFVNGTLPSKTKPVSADLFLKPEGDPHKDMTIDSDDKFDLKTSDWDKFLQYGFNFKDHPDKMGISPIQEITSSLLMSDNLGDKILFDDSFVGDFRSYAMGQLAIGKIPVVFHFSTQQYLTRANVVCRTGPSPELKDASYLAQQAVFLDFDIIELTFNKDGVYTVIPVVSDPIDIFNDVTAPPKSDWGLGDIWKYIFGIIILVIVLILLGPVLPYIFKFVIWVIALPFRAVGWCFKKIGKKE